MAADTETTPWVRAVAHRAWSAGRTDVVLVLGTDEVVPLPVGAAAVLQACRRPDTLDAHAARLPATARSMLTRLVAARLLVGADDVRAALATAVPSTPASPPTPAAWCVPTACRPAQAAALAVALGRTGVPVRIYDQAGDVPAALASADAGDAAVATPASTAAWAALLGAAIGDVPLATWALLGREGAALRTGANRNVLLLDAAGEVVLSVDDDVQPRAIVGQGDLADPAAWRLLSGGDPTTVRFSPSVAEATSGAVPIDLASLLCAGLLADARVVAGGAALRDAEASLCDRLASASPVPVFAACAGIAGDSGWGRGDQALFFGDEARAALVADYERLIASRAVVRAAARPTLTDSPFFMATAYALDARVVLPPYFPHGRNAEGPWSVLAQHVLRAGVVAHLPVAVHHAPPVDRRFDPATLGTTWDRPRVNDLLAHWLGRMAPAGPGPEGLAAAGAGLTAIATLPEAQLRDRVADAHRTLLAQGLTALAGAAAVPAPHPTAWREDVDRLARALLAAMSDIAPPDGYDGPAAWPAFRADLGRYAQLVSRWPQLLDAAVDLRADGVRPTRPS
jgi:hypothetical protein